MPVTVTCSQCQTAIELDDGFRGGVCRCKNCGTLIPVPRAADEGVARVARPAAPPSSGIHRQRSPERSATDTGGSSASLISPRPLPTTRPQAKPPATPAKPPSITTPPPPPAVASRSAPAKSRTTYWIIAAVILLALIAIATIVETWRGHP